MRTVEDLLSLAAYCRDRINPQMFVYSLSVAILHRPDTKHLTIPRLSEVFPDKYMDSRIFNRAKEEANVVPAGSRVCSLPTPQNTNFSPWIVLLYYYSYRAQLRSHWTTRRLTPTQSTASPTGARTLASIFTTGTGISSTHSTDPEWRSIRTGAASFSTTCTIKLWPGNSARERESERERERGGERGREINYD